MSNVKYRISIIRYWLFAIRHFLFLILLTALYLFVRSRVVGSFGRVAEYPGGSFYATLLTMSKVFANYFKLLLYPAGLRAIYEVPISTHIDREVFLSLTTITTLLFLALLGAWRGAWQGARKMAFSILWIFVSLLPFSNIVPTGTLMAERYLYLASAGFSWLCADFFESFFKIWEKQGQNGQKSLVLIRTLTAGTMIVVVGICFLFFLSTLNRNRVWHDGLTLWQDTVQKTPSSAIAHNNLGNAYRQKGIEEGEEKWIRAAIEEHRLALKLDPTFAVALSNLGTDFMALGDLNRAEEIFFQATQMAPQMAVAHFNLALIYFKRDHLEEALQEAQIALDLDPLNFTCTLLLARLHDRLQNEALAICQHTR